MTTAVATRGASAAPPTPLRRNLNLARELAITQFKLKYTGSVLGYLWSLLKPLMVFATMYAIFVYLFQTDRASPDFAIQLLVGIVVWTFFVEAIGGAMGSIAGNAALIRKAYFSRPILVIASTLTAALTFLINMALIIAIAVPLGRLHLGLRTLMVPVLVAELYVLVLGLSLFLSAVFVYYRDVGHLWEVSSNLLFYASAVVYPFAIIPGKYMPKIIASGPVAQVIEDIRHCLVTPQVPWTYQITGSLFLVPLLLTVAIAALGVWTFRRLEPRFADSL